MGNILQTLEFLASKYMSVVFSLFFAKIGKKNPATGWQKIKMPVENMLTLVKSTYGYLEYDAAAFPIISTVDECRRKRILNFKWSKVINLSHCIQCFFSCSERRIIISSERGVCVLFQNVFHILDSYI